QIVTVTQGGQAPCGVSSTGLAEDALGLRGTSGKCFAATGSSAEVIIYVFLSRTDCNWKATTDTSWIHVTGSTPRLPTSPPTAQAEVRYTVDPNAGTTLRRGNIFINGVVYRVTQAGTATTARGRVTTSSGTPLRGVTITFSSLTGASAPPSAQTDSD